MILFALEEGPVVSPQGLFHLQHMIIWFNGPSQTQLATTLPRQSIEIGCNYIEQTRPVDAVAAFDIDVVQQIKTNPTTQYYTRADAHLANWQLVDNHIVSGANSGILACWIAVNCFPKQKIYIIGCDWGLTDDSSFDHIYQKGPRRKYTNHSRKKIQMLFKHHDVEVVHDQQPDVPLPIITEDHFLRKIQ